MIEMCEEMYKLRDKLDMMDVPWEDNSYVMSESMIEAMHKACKKQISRDFIDATIYRTYFVANGVFCSVIYGFNTHGGIDPVYHQDRGLLELMGGHKNIGFLTADEVIHECFGAEY